MSNLTFRALQRDLAICAVLLAAPLHRGRILRGIAAPMLHRWTMTLHAGQLPSVVAR